MAMLRELCTDQAHLIHPATTTADGRGICPVCTGARSTERNALSAEEQTMDVDGARIGDMTLCGGCNKAIQLWRSRNPDTNLDIDFWIHFASARISGPPETHRAFPKRRLIGRGANDG